MKDISQSFIEKEESSQRQPAELYHFWTDNGSNHWYYTSVDDSITYDGHSYTPASIRRGSVSYNSELEISTLQITVDWIEDPVMQYIATNPVDVVWVRVLKVHRDDLSDADVIFIGQIKTVKFKGNVGQVHCVGFEQFLRMPVPVWRYQLNCNHKIFDSYCGLSASSYKVTATVSASSDGKTLTATEFGNYSDNYFTLGKVVFGDESRPIVRHAGTSIRIAYVFSNDPDGQSVDAYPGCDGDIGTCKDKFNNIDNFLGFPFIPQDNPSMRTP